MKRIICIASLLYGLSAQAQTPAEAVGINTETPRGVLHIDGGATDSQPADDVLIDSGGRLGAGLTAPEAKVDLSAAAEGDALRIADGTQGEGKVLTSGADGAASWTTLATGVRWYAALYTNLTFNAGEYVFTTGTEPRPLAAYANELISTPNQGGVDRLAGTIRVPSAGIYRITVSQHYMSNRSAPYWALTELRVNGTGRWHPSTWGHSMGWGTLPTYTAILRLEADNLLQLFLLQAETFSANYSAVSLFMVELLQAAQ